MEAPGPAAGAGASPGLFGDRVAAAVAERGSQILLGLDPDPARLWPAALEEPRGERSGDRSPAARAARSVARHCELLVEAVGGACVGVKLQLACFERLGAPGWSALEAVAARARDAGLLVVADGKRGDIDVSAAAYAQALLASTPTPFGVVEGLGADALTVNALLGAETLAPLLKAARPRGRGLFVLVRTSNPGAADVQEAALESGGDVSDRLASIVADLGSGGIGASGLSDVGAVVGATAPGRLAELRAAMPAAIMLLPGVGAQGGRVEALAPAFEPGRAGGLVSVSRGLAFAHESAGGAPADAARREAERLRALAWGLA